VNDLEKYDFICKLVEKTYPVLAPVWRAAGSRFGDKWLKEFIVNLEAIYGPVNVNTGSRMAEALDGYAEFVNDSLRNQAFFEKHGHYKASSYAECVDAYYHNADHMKRCYLPGMYLSHLLWPQHYNMLCSFRDGLLRRLGDPKLFFEVGVGCGMYSKTLLDHFRHVQGVGFDISSYALEFTKNLVTMFGHGDRYSIEQRDIRHGYNEKCDFLVCQEVLEHLENPGEFCGWLHNMIKPGGKAYITAALNAAHSDHIFLFREPLELEEMLRAARFQPLSLQEEFAAGYKPRHITPSLAGYLVERL
jgi:SAM-dependent methyltransferase